MAPTVFWPTLLGLVFLAAGVISYRRDIRPDGPSNGFGLVALGPVFIAAALAAFAGEHFTLATALATMVPKWLPARLFIAWFVGFAHLAAALSFVARRFMRWSTIALAVMFGLFVLLMDLPGAMARPSPLAFMLAARQATFAIGALALFAAVERSRSPRASRTIATIARIWTGIVLVAYGAQHLVHPEYAPGVPSPVHTAAWVPFPSVVAYATGLLLIVFGVMMLARRSASTAAALGGLLMLLLTVVLYGPDFFLAQNADQRLTAVNFIFDTMLFAGTVLVVSRAIALAESQEIAGSQGST